MPEIHFVTNRNPLKGGKPLTQKELADGVQPDGFGVDPSGGGDLRFGSAVVNRGSDGKYAHDRETLRAFAEELKYEGPVSSRTPTGYSVKGSDELFERLKRLMRSGCDCLIYVHGYSVTFNQALATAGEMADKYGRGRKLSVVVFTWPSDGGKLYNDYFDDRADAKSSGHAFARGLLKLVKLLRGIEEHEACEGRLFLLCHSMGNYVLRHGFQEAKRMSGGAPTRLFDQLFMLAADEDADTFERDYKLQQLPLIAGGVNVYFNRQDVALLVSDKTKFNPPRLGSIGPVHPHTLPGNVTLIDCTDVVRTKYGKGHSYYTLCPKVVKDVRRVMKEGAEYEDTTTRRWLPAQNRWVLL